MSGGFELFLCSSLCKCSRYSLAVLGNAPHTLHQCCSGSKNVKLICSASGVSIDLDFFLFNGNGQLDFYCATKKNGGLNTEQVKILTIHHDYDRYPCVSSINFQELWSSNVRANRHRRAVWLLLLEVLVVSSVIRCPIYQRIKFH